MPKTAGHKFGSLLLPLYVLAVLAGMATGVAAGVVLSGVAAIQRAIEPGLTAGWGSGGLVIIPVLVGLPIGAVISLAPATGAVVGLFLQAWNVPFPSIRSQARAAACGAGSASTLLAGVVLFLNGTPLIAALAIGTTYALVSFLLASAITTRLLRYRESREAAAEAN